MLIVFREQSVNIPASNFLYSFFDRGLLFDASVNAYLLLVPFILLSLSDFIPKVQRFVNILVIVLIYILYVAAIALYSADIPFFGYYNSRLTIGIFSWIDNFGLMIKIFFSRSDFYPFIAVFFIISFFFCMLIRNIYKKLLFNKTSRYNKKYYTKILYFFLILMILFIGIRGEISLKTYPLRVDDAFTRDYSFPNQLGLNPVYCFISSALRENKKLIEDTIALKNVRSYLGVGDTNLSPVARKISFTETSSYPNVVLFIVESLSTFKFKKFGYKNNVMPFLDSLMNYSAIFDNVYTAGMHTFNGVYSTLTSIPTAFTQKSFVSPVIAAQKHSGISNVLKLNGYNTVFFCSGDKHFDNMNSFLKNNDFDEVFGQEIYPPDAERTEWGVHDNVMYEFALPKMNGLSEKGKPFLSVILTVSTHEAVNHPAYKDKKRSDEFIDYDERFEYADWALSEFFRIASKQSWFQNTVFVFIADHGQNFEQTYELPLAYFHSPLIFYSPALVEPSVFSAPGLQIDLFPTLMGYLKIPYVNNTLGVDLRKEKRKFAYFTSDTKIGCISDKFYCLFNTEEVGKLYNYRLNDIKDYTNEYEGLKDSMQIYSFSNLTVAAYLAEKKLLSLPNIVK
jgi:phosphoglycerol transferase MdoB-like AlkP superfamily enzyme